MNDADRIAEIVAGWQQQRAAGLAPSIDVLVSSYPDLGTSLHEALAAVEALDRLAWSAHDEDGPDPVDSLPSVEPPRIADLRIVREVGRGGMGMVYEAEQVSMGRRVAVKVLYPALAPSPRAIERFRREAQATGRLRHTSVVQIYGLGQQDGRWHTVMELVRGASLATLIERERARRAGDGPDEAVPFFAAGRDGYARIAESFASVAEALAAAHEAGVVHRDVKPSNLMLDESGQLKILDFGLASLGEASDGLTLSGDVLGTPAYMSPEQARSRPVDGRADVYALGATLYEVLTLRPPFREQDTAATLLALLTRDPPPVRQVAPRVPQDLATIVAKAMEKRPQDRYASASDLARDLRAFSLGHPVAARPVGVVGRAIRRARRHPVRSALALGLGVAVLAAAAFWLIARDAESKRDAEAARRRALEYDALITRAVTVSDLDGEKTTGELLDEAIALDPSRPDAWYLGALRRDCEPERRLAELEEAVRRGLSADRAALARGIVLRMAGRGPEDTVGAAIEPDPSDLEACTLRAGIDELDGKTDAVLARLDKVMLTAEPGQRVYANVLLTRARVLMRVGRYGDALLDLSAYRAQTPAERPVPPTDARIAWLWKRMERPEDAERQVARTLEAYARTAGPKSFLRLVQQFRDDGEDPWAERALAAGLARHPEDPDLRLAAAQTEDAERRLEVAKEVLAKHPDHAKARVERASALLDLGHAQEALDAADELLVTHARFEPPHYVRARALEDLGRWKDAEAAYREGLERYPRSVRFSDGLARTLTLLGRGDEALAMLDKMIAVEPSNTFLRGQKIIALRRLGREPQAVEEAKALIVRAPDPANLPMDAALLVAWSDPGSLVPVLEAALETKPAALPARLQLANAVRAQGRVKAALEVLDREPALEPAYAVLSLRMRFLLDLRELDRAVEVARALRARWPSDPAGWSVEAQCHMLAGRFAEGIPLFEKQLELLEHPTPRFENGQWFGTQAAPPGHVVYARNSLVFAFRSTGQLDKALEQSRLAEAAAGADAGLLTAVLGERARTYLAQGEGEQAAAAARRAVELVPGDARAHAALGDVLVAASDLEGADAAYAQTLSLAGERALPLWWSVRAQILWSLDRLDESLACARKAIAEGHRSERTFAIASLDLSLAAEASSEALAEAVELARSARAASAESGWAACALGAALARQGGRDEDALALLLAAYHGEDIPDAVPLSLMIAPYQRLGREDDVAQVRAALAAHLVERPEFARHRIIARLAKAAQGPASPPAAGK